MSDEQTHIVPTRTANQCAAIRAGISQTRIDQYVGLALSDGLACLNTAHLIAICDAIADLDYDSRTKTYDVIVGAIVCVIDVHSRAHYALNPVHDWEPPDVFPLSQIADAFVRAFADVHHGKYEDNQMFSAIYADNTAIYEHHIRDEGLFAQIRDDPKGCYDAWERQSAEYVTDMDRFERQIAYNRIVSRCTDDWAYTALMRECTLRKNALRLCTSMLREFTQIVEARIDQTYAPERSRRPMSVPVHVAASADAFATARVSSHMRIKFTPI
jgi:hypothetical protein